MTEKLKGESLKAYRVWKLCIHSGLFVKIEIIEGTPVSMGFCNKKNRDIDFEFECPSCKDHRTTRTPPKHERTATRKARIGTARRRSIKRRQEVFDMKTGIKKH